MTKIDTLKRLFFDYTRKHFKKISLSVFFAMLVAGSTSAIAYLLDPAIKKIFIEKDQTLILIIPILIIVILVAFAMWLSASLSAKVGPIIIIVVQKIFGILLGALAIEFVVAGVIESFKL